MREIGYGQLGAYYPLVRVLPSLAVGKIFRHKPHAFPKDQHAFPTQNKGTGSHTESD